jgi:hypothetical protein
MRSFARLAGVLVAVVLGSLAAAAENWRPIGTVTFDDPWQRAVIAIPAGTGGLAALRFDVKGADLEVGDIKVTFGNGEVADIAVRAVFRGGTSSRRIELRGGARTVKQVAVIYRAHGPTRFIVLGDVVEIPAVWSQLGCKPVNFGIDRDVIKVGRDEGVFSKLRLRVAGAAVEFFDVAVVYGNGQRDTLKVRSVIRAGGETRPIDLSGKVRGISRIELLYRSQPSLLTKAAVCADGLLRP